MALEKCEMCEVYRLTNFHTFWKHTRLRSSASDCEVKVLRVAVESVETEKRVRDAATIRSGSLRLTRTTYVTSVD